MVLGALNAVREAGKMRPDQFFGGIDGESEAVAEIKKGRPYKISISLASFVWVRYGPACGRLARRQEYSASHGHPSQCVDCGKHRPV